MYRIRIIFVFLLLSQLLFAQQGRYVFNRLTTQDGLASNQVYDIIQDKKGFIWFGTANGLQRFDGNKIISFRLNSKDDSSFLPVTPVHQMLIDKKNNFWIRSGKEAGIFNPNNFKFKKVRLANSPDDISKTNNELRTDSKGNIYLLRLYKEILKYDSATNSFSPEGLPFRIPEGWKPLDVVEDPFTHNYWICADSGLALYDIKEQQVYYRDNNPKKLVLFDDPRLRKTVLRFYIDKNNHYWIISWPGASQLKIRYDPVKKSYLPDPEGTYSAVGSYHEFYRFTELSNGELWAYGMKVLMNYDSTANRFNYIYEEFPDEFSIKYTYIFHIFEDREKNAWLATDQGVYVFNPGDDPVINLLFKKDPKRSDNNINAVVEVNNNEIWVGSWGKGVSIVDKNFNKKFDFYKSGVPAEERSSYYQVWTICKQEKTGMIWAGCQNGKIIIYDPVKKKKYFLDPPEFEHRTVRCIVEDIYGNLWFSTQGGNIVKWSPDSSSVEKGFKIVERFKKVIGKIYADNKGYIWICRDELLKMDAMSQAIVAEYSSRKRKNYSLYSNQVTDIVQYNDSIFFVASEALNVLNTRSGRIEQFGYFQGLPSNTISTMALGKDGSLWLSTLNGIARFNYQTKFFTRYGRKDGIIYNDISADAVRTLSDGNVVFAGDNYLFMIDPARLVSSKHPPDVSITDFKLFNNYLPPDSILSLDKVKLNYDQNSITIEFSTLSFSDREKVNYYYKLEGAQDEWRKAEGQLAANYSLLPPGNYTFMVKCENSEGISSENITQLKIYIKPPFWKTYWFLTLVCLFFATAGYLIHYLMMSKLIAVQNIRNRVARDLHDDMGSTLSTINILSSMAKSRISSDTIKTTEYLGKISDNSQRMMEAMDDIVWSIKPTNDSMQKIMARMLEFATNVLESKDIDIDFQIDEDVQDIRLNMEERRDLFLAFKEAVNNAAKYSRASKVLISIKIENRRLVLRVKDNGRGFNVDTADSGNGLGNMHKRADSLRGQLLIKSEINEGTEVILTMPLNN